MTDTATGIAISPCKVCGTDIENGTVSKPNPISNIDTIDSSNKLLYYEIEDVPPWYLSILLGFQHYLTMAGSTVSVPFILTPLLCMATDDPNKANIISTLIFVSGIVTLLQSCLGTRLPIIQGGSFSFLIPSLAILTLPEWKCPEPDVFDGLTDSEKLDLWQVRIREIQGAIIVAAIFELFFGFFGIIGLIIQFITPMTVAPTICMIGLSLFKTAADSAASNWTISILTMVLLGIFSQYCRNIRIPIPFTKSKENDGRLVRFPFFQIFPVLITMTLVWVLCYILTATDVLSPGNLARTDLKTKIIDQSPWFRFPYPFQWGWPTVSVGAVLGMLSGVIAGTVESVGDYYSCARICGIRPPENHAVNRGIFVEGLGCILAGIWGSGNGTTSYALNIGAMSVTKVGSRRVIQTAGIIMILFGLVGKIGAVFISIPEPVIGGVFCIVFATVTAVGLSNLQGVELNSPRNVFIIGVSIFMGLTVSQWMESNSDVIKTGVESIDQIITILLKTGMFVSGFLGFFLDNTIPGTNQERGLLTWNAEKYSEEKDANLLANPTDKPNCYDLPFGMELIRRQKWLKWFPMSPTYDKGFGDKGQKAKLPK